MKKIEEIIWETPNLGWIKIKGEVWKAQRTPYKKIPIAIVKLYGEIEQAITQAQKNMEGGV